MHTLSVLATVLECSSVWVSVPITLIRFLGRNYIQNHPTKGSNSCTSTLSVDDFQFVLRSLSTLMFINIITFSSPEGALLLVSNKNRFLVWPKGTRPLRALEVCKNSFLAVANLHAPVKKKRVRNSKAPCLTPEINRLMWERKEQSESPQSLMISWNGQSTNGLRMELTILLTLPKRITIILTLRITLEKQKQLGME